MSDAQRLANLGSWEWDIATNTVTWSDELYRIWGVNPQEFGANYEAVLQLVHPDDREFLAPLVERSYREHEPYTCEHRIIRPDEETRVLQSRGAVVVDEAGHAIRMFGTGQDITERKLAEEALRRAQEELEQRVIERTEQFATVNKELIKEINEREGAERALRESQEQALRQYREIEAIYRTAPVGLCFISNGLRLLKMNKPGRVCRLAACGRPPICGGTSAVPARPRI